MPTPPRQPETLLNINHIAVLYLLHRASCNITWAPKIRHHHILPHPTATTNNHNFPRLSKYQLHHVPQFAAKLSTPTSPSFSFNLPHASLPNQQSIHDSVKASRPPTSLTRYKWQPLIPTSPNQPSKSSPHRPLKPTDPAKLDYANTAYPDMQSPTPVKYSFPSHHLLREGGKKIPKTTVLTQPPTVLKLTHDHQLFRSRG